MKILMVNKFLYPRGGSESYMLSLGSYFEKLGHKVWYFGMYDEKNTVSNPLELYTQNMDFHSKGLARFLYPFKIIYSFETAKKIGKILDELKPDVVHMNNINFQLTPSLIYAVKKRKIPLVQTVHDYQMICPNHLFYDFKNNKPCEKCLKGSSFNCFKNKCIHGSGVKSLIGAIEKIFYSVLKTYKKVDLYVCPSNFLSGKLLSSNSFYQDKTFTIHNFIDKNTFNGDEIPGGTYVAFVGRLSKEKGVDLLRETALLLPDVQFKVAGGGPDEESLKGIANIELMGFLKGEKLCDFVKKSKFLLLPSVCYENCPLSILEAHSMGVPVVTMNYGGMAELVKDGTTGLLCEDATPVSLKGKIETLMNNSELYNSIKENCEKEKNNIQSIESYCDILLSKYNEIINRG